MMTLTLTLAPELEFRLKKEAERRGVPLEQCALKTLDEYVPSAAEAKADRLAKLFQQWNEEDVDESEMLDDEFFLRMDENRPAGSKLFPPELKGITW